MCRSDVARIFVLLMVVAICAGAAPADWKMMITTADRKRDDQGKLLPLPSYDETPGKGERGLTPSRSPIRRSTL